MMQKKRVAIALGSNLGDRRAQIETAARLIQEEFLENAVLSPLFETAPWGVTEQPSFYNAVLVGDSEWKGAPTLNYLKELEQRLGREKRVKNGPREIDLDLLICGDERINETGIEVPHPGIAFREFVLVPLVAVWPDWQHPVLKKTVREMLDSLENRTFPKTV